MAIATEDYLDTQDCLILLHDNQWTRNNRITSPNAHP